MEGYTPNEQVLARLNGVHFVAVVGPTAAGKSTLIREALARNNSLHVVRNNTSRPPRPGEEGGIEYRFHTREEMLERIKRREYVQIAPVVLEHLYATAPEDYSAQGISLLPVLSAAVPVFRSLPFASFRIVYVLPSDFTLWQERIAEHNFSAEQLRKRLKEAADSLNFASTEPDISFVMNGTLADSVNEFVRVVKGDQPKLVASQGRNQAARLLRQLQKVYQIA